MRSILTLAAVALLSLPAAARADAPALSAAQILANIDTALNGFKDGVFESKLLVKQPTGESREYGFTTFQKGSEKRLVRFTSPGDVKGMGVLVESKDTMYVFLPGFQRVRRMGTHIKNQTFMGSDFSFDDMSQVAYTPVFDAKLVGQDETNYILELTAKAGLDLEMPRLKLWADKTMFQPTRIEFCDGTGKKLKTQVRTGYKKDAPNHWQPAKVVVTDHRRNDHTSEIDFVNTKIDSGLSDDLFSVRSLVRGN